MPEIDLFGASPGVFETATKILDDVCDKRYHFVDGFAGEEWVKRCSANSMNIVIHGTKCIGVLERLVNFAIA
ncbi:MAG: hypothetical protein Q9160_002166 [Pyrenula sp. 1 TL-2023]